MTMKYSASSSHGESLTSEQIWNAVFGLETRDSVLADAHSQSITPQDYTTSSLLSAIDQGLDVDRMEAYNDLCRQLQIDVC